MPHSSPGSTLVVSSKRLTGQRLERFAARALRSREFEALDRALKARGFHSLRSKPYARASLKEKLIVVPYGDGHGGGDFAGLLAGKGKRRAEARFTNAVGQASEINRSRLVVASGSGQGSSLTARAAGLDILCIGICLQSRTRRCQTGVPKCIRLFSLPFVGNAAGVACVAAVCAPEALRCIRKCL